MNESGQSSAVVSITPINLNEVHGLPLINNVSYKYVLYYLVAELGDYDPRKHQYGYVSEFRIIANQTRDLECRIAELHQQLHGMTPAQCELTYLDKVKWHDMYGVDLHPVLVSYVSCCACRRWRLLWSSLLLRHC